MDYVAFLKAGIHSEAVIHDGSDQHTGGNAQISQEIRYFLSDGDADDAELGNQAAFGVGQIGKLLQISLWFVNGNVQIELSLPRKIWRFAESPMLPI